MTAIMSHRFGSALVEAGVLTQEELIQTRRIVIDAQQGEAVVMYLERYADDKILNVRTTLEGIEIEVRESPSP